MILVKTVTAEDRTFSIRPALPRDKSVIRQLVANALINPIGLDWKRFIVAVTEENKVIGCGQVKQHRDGSWEMASIVVETSWRRKGVARKIINQLLSLHDEDLYLMCRSDLGEMYEKFGFRILEESEMPIFFRRVNKLSGVIDLLRREGVYLLVMGRMKN